jgi:hypothetical protein
LKEEDLPFLSRCQPLPAATNPNSDGHSRILQTPQTLNGKNNPKQAYPKMQLQLFFFF